jgi:hypothetical protein
VAVKHRNPVVLLCIAPRGYSALHVTNGDDPCLEGQPGVLYEMLPVNGWSASPGARADALVCRREGSRW